MQAESTPIRDLAWVLGTDGAGLIGRQASRSIGAAMRFATPALLRGAALDLFDGVAPGAWIEAGGFWYQRAPIGASGPNVVATAAGVLLYVMPESAGWNPKAFGAAWDGVTDDTAAIQAALDAAGLAAGNTPDGAFQTVIFPPGMTRANGLLVESSNVRLVGPGCNLRSYQAQASRNFVLTFRGGGYDEGTLINNNAIDGLVISGANHANVCGLALEGVAHFRYYNVRLRSFGGAGGGCAFSLINVWDSVFWGGFIDWSGLDGGSLAASTPAMQILATTIDNSNQLFFYNFTWEANAGVDLAILQPAEATSFYNNAISFIAPKWEQSTGRVVYAGLYVPSGYQNSLSIEGKAYIAGYHLPGGCWADISLSTSGKFTLSPSTDFGYKTDQPAGAGTLATIILRGNGSALIGGRLNAIRASLVPFLDLQNVTDPVQVEYSDVSCAYDYQDGWLMVQPGALQVRCDIDAAQLRHRFVLAPNDQARFVPRGAGGIMTVMTVETATLPGPASGQAVFRRRRGSGDRGGAIGPAVSPLNVSSGLEWSVGALVASGSTTLTVDKIHCRVSDAAAQTQIQNRTTETRIVTVSLQPTRI